MKGWVIEYKDNHPFPCGLKNSSTAREREYFCWNLFTRSPQEVLCGDSPGWLTGLWWRGFHESLTVHTYTLLGSLEMQETREDFSPTPRTRGNGVFYQTHEEFSHRVSKTIVRISCRCSFMFDSNYAGEQNCVGRTKRLHSVKMLFVLRRKIDTL